MVLRLKWLAVIFLSLGMYWGGQVLAESQKTSSATKEIIFEKKMILINKKKLTVEIAKSDQQHEHGLMFRKKLGLNQGMLFIFDDEQIRNFWMKDTIINLSIGYFDKNKKLIDIQEMKATTSVMEQNLQTYPSASPAMYALEMTEGWFAKNKIKPGSSFEFVK